MPDLDLSPENLRASFQSLNVQSNSLLEQLNPLWEELAAITDGTWTDGNLAEARAREATLRADIRALQDQRAPIEQQRASLAQLLRDRTTGLANTGPIPDDLVALRDRATDD